MSEAPCPSANPYAPPASSLSQDPALDAVWRKGKLMIMGRGASIPDRCVSCNAPATTRLRRKLHWHRSWVYIFIMMNVLVYALIALAVRKNAEVQVPLCDWHLKRRRLVIAAAWSTALAGLGCMLSPLLSEGSSQAVKDAVGLAVLFGIFVCIPIASFVGISTSQPVIARKIDAHHVWLGRCSKKFLDTLPTAPAHF